MFKHENRMECEQKPTVCLRQPHSFPLVLLVKIVHKINTHIGRMRVSGGDIERQRVKERMILFAAIQLLSHNWSIIYTIMEHMETATPHKYHNNSQVTALVLLSTKDVRSTICLYISVML